MQSKERVRLQKYLADAGVASRRKAEAWIAQGRVSVNGVVTTTLGTTVDPSKDTVLFDGKPVRIEGRLVTYVLNKPVGLICSNSESQGATILSLFKEDLQTRLFPVGRLDKYSEGILLVTNDGDLALRLTHPRHGHTKTYDVTVNGTVDEAQLRRMCAPMLLDGYRTRGARVWRLAEGASPPTTTLRVILLEGRSRQIRNMCANLALPIRRLRRIRIGMLDVGALRPGEYRLLTARDLPLLEQPDVGRR
jgi:23S rRNA pseudouridine2605 synthase